jgi:hypothetical protein
VFLWFGASKRVRAQISSISDKEIFMAAPVPTPSGSPAYPLFLFLAFALTVLSLWGVDTGLVEQQLSPSRADIAVTTLTARQGDSRSHRPAASLEDLAFGSWGAIKMESEGEAVRRKATIALMVYATGNGVRR